MSKVASGLLDVILAFVVVVGGIAFVDCFFSVVAAVAIVFVVTFSLVAVAEVEPN